MLLRNKTLDYPNSCLNIFIFKQNRLADTFPCLLYILHPNARGKNLRLVVSSLQIARLFQCRNGRSHASLYIRHRIVPPSLSGNFQRRATDLISVSSHIFHSLPYLLYLAYAQLGLVQQYKVFVKVVIGVQNKASGIQMWVSTRTPCLLHIVLQRIRNVIVHHQANVAFVHSHTKGRCCNNYPNLFAHKRFLIGHLIVRIHLSVKWQGLIPISGQLLSQLLGSFGARNVHNRRAIFRCNKRTKFCVLILIALRMNHRIV